MKSVVNWEAHLKPAERRAVETLRQAREVRRAELAEISRDLTALKRRAQARARSKFHITSGPLA